MKESIFQQELKKTFEDAGYWCEKFPDGIRTAQTRFIPKKPADLIAVVKGLPILIECKMITEIRGLNYNFFGSGKEKKDNLHWTEYHQTKELLNFSSKTQGLAYYAINIRIQNPKRINVMLMIEINRFFHLYSYSDVITKENLNFMVQTGVEGRKGRFSREMFDQIENDKMLFVW